MNKKRIQIWLQILIFLLGFFLLYHFLFQNKCCNLQNPKQSFLSVQKPHIIKAADQQIPLSHITANTFAIAANQSFWIGGKTQLLHLSEQGSFLEKIKMAEPIHALTISWNNDIYAATKNQIIIYSRDLSEWRETRFEKLEGQAYITSICLSANLLFVADAGNKQLHAYDLKGKMLWSTRGKDPFIIPSPYFDVMPDNEGGVWIVNPGRHRIEKYNQQGEYVALWKPSEKNRFLGCCNPAHAAMLSGERFVTLEKGLIQSRIFSPSGQVERMVAQIKSSDRFAYELDVKKDGSIVILDGVHNMLLIFKEKEGET